MGALIGAPLLLAVAGYSGAYGVYRAAKLKAIEPRELRAPIEWAGESHAPSTLLLVGDSRIARWPLEAQPGWRVGRLGFPGEAAVNIEPSVRNQIATVRADVVVIQAGGNDATAAVFEHGERRTKTIARAERAVIAIGEKARDAGAREVIVLTIVPAIEMEFWKRALMGSAQTELMKTLGRGIADEARARGMTVLDADALFRNREGNLDPEYRSDSLHWSAAGYRALNAALWAQMTQCANQRP